MSEKPIIFSTPMVQAILDGRKTQTRRVVKPQPKDVRWRIDSLNGDCYYDRVSGASIKMSYQPGDVLWVRETWKHDNVPDKFIYKASESPTLCVPWRPSIYMPRAAARIFLRVTDVRVEQGQEININGMIAEGVIHKNLGGQWQQLQQEYYAPLWDSFNAKHGFDWEVNPWVWVISFDRMEA